MTQQSFESAVGKVLRRIRKERLDRKMSLREASDAVEGVSFQNWCQVELGHRGASAEVLQRMASRLGLEIVWSAKIVKAK